MARSTGISPTSAASQSRIGCCSAVQRLTDIDALDRWQDCRRQRLDQSLTRTCCFEAWRSERAKAKAQAAGRLETFRACLRKRLGQAYGEARDGEARLSGPSTRISSGHATHIRKPATFGWLGARAR